jgi:hypothetical protein
MNVHSQTHRQTTLAGLAILILPAVVATAADTKLTVTDFPAPGLIAFKLDSPLDAKTTYVLKDDNRTIPAQLDADGRLWWYQPTPCAGQPGCTYTLVSTPASDTGSSGVKVEKVKDGLIDISIDGRPFTTFNYGDDTPKPFLYPVIGPTGAPVTRNYPMKDVPEERGHNRRTNRQDHPHHRSIWTAHGDVRLGDFDRPGTDYWTQGKGKGVEKVARIVRTVSGPVFGLIEADIDWINAAGKKELSETRTYRFYKDGQDQRTIDLKVVFKFTQGDVMFADTKESGIVSLRLAVSMDEQTAGKMCNSNGRVGERQCWGKHAAWCDYVGPIDGQTIGIAVFDAKTNFGHPTPWHIRAYGLYAANPFGLHAFGEQTDGSHIFKKGETTEFNYRILIHKGDTKQAHVADEYRIYTEPAKVAMQ